MSKLEKSFAISLGLLVVLALGVVIVGPILSDRLSSSERVYGPGDTETMVARVVEIVEEGSVDLGQGASQPYQKLLLHIESGSLAGEEVVVEEGTVNIISQARLYKLGDRVYLERVVGPDVDRFYISDFVRTTPLIFVGVLFAALVVLVGRSRGLRSLIGTLLSLVMIFVYVLPQIGAGRDPVVVSIVGSTVLLAVSTYVTYGWNPKAHAAVVGMMFSLALSGGLASLFVGWTRLTGLSVEEGAYLVMEFGSDFDLRGLVLAGVIIGAIGVLDDVCVAQASAVFELLYANRDLGWRELFVRSMNIGRDHIAAMVNTLLLAYVGASMPLMLVFTIYQEPIWRRINREPVAEEIVRTLVGSMGLILAVPITSLVASLVARWALRRELRRLSPGVSTDATVS
ncbi:MAG: YibE/F family protein [Anaerolineae bacterium]|nr:YibE/F family protein [Anaerolineae bacterium]